MLPVSTVSRIPAMVAASAITTVPGWVSLCGNMAPMAAMVVFFAPFPTINQVTREKSVGSLPLLPYSSMIANCFLWLSYGVLKSESKIWGTNLIGLFFGLFYFMKFVRYAPPESPTLPGSVQHHVNACLAVMATAFSLKFLLRLKDPTSIIGNLAVMFCVAMFASPLAALKTVLKTKSAKSIPLPFTLATVLNCFLWSVTGLFDMKDVNIYLPNLLGLAFGIGQIALKLLFGNGITTRAESEKALLM